MLALAYFVGAAMTRPATIVLVALLAMAPSARADQFQYLDMRQAVAAMKRLHAGDVVQAYCAPCGDRRAQRITVAGTGIDRVWDGRNSSRVYRDDASRAFWQFELNGRPVDLAYVYIRDGRRWRNLAMALGLAPVQVPATLPSDAIDGG
jgi:hypothetical protein